MNNTIGEPSPQDHGELMSQLPDIIAKVNTGWFQISQNEWDNNIANQIQQIFYRISISSAVLGYKKISGAAREIENCFRDLIRENGADKSHLENANQLLNEFVSIVKTDKPSVNQSDTDEDSQILSIKDNRTSRIIYLFEYDNNQSETLAAQIGYFGYVVKTFTDISELSLEAEKSPPQAILIDIDVSDDLQCTFQSISQIRKQSAISIPIIFISSNNSLENRLQSVRAGGEAYFSKPVDVGDLIDMLDSLIVHEEPDPYRVIIVDDTLVQAKYFSIHLNKKGMETSIVTDPLKIMEPLYEFNPELILLDINMPDCTGMELAKVIRQIDKFISIPIVYLSAETDKDIQLEAMSLGGDDFLAKPIKPEHLITSVSTRIERYRKLRSLIYHDGLTGLLNHTTMKEILVQEVSRANRQNSDLSFAMLDLDKFKNVNDIYGHATGDRVLRSLSRLLKQRLRKTDYIGRFGGEEFAVILPNTSLFSAEKLMDNLRSSFENIQHLSKDSVFSVSFSCGVASYPQYTTAISLSEAADAALYTAKNQGRNQVVIAP